MKPRTVVKLAVVMLGLSLAVSAAAPPPVLSGFTYQGYLKDGNVPANGTYDFRFRLYDLPTAGVNVGGSLLVDDVVVTGGRFSVTLNFAASIFDGSDRYLLVSVRPGNSTGDYTNLLPRQKLEATPYALRAEDTSRFGGLYPSDYVKTAGDSMTGPLTVNAPEASIALETVATTTGLSGVATSSNINAAGVRGIATAGSGTPAGVEGVAGWFGGNGVRGLAAAATTADRSAIPSYYRSGGEFYGPNGIIGLGIPGYFDGYGVFGAATGASGRGVFGSALTTTGTAYGVYGRSVSPVGYGGYFENSAVGGSAIRAGGSGIIRSSANTEIIGNPFSLTTFNPNPNITLNLNSNGYMTITGAVATSTFVYLPVEIPAVLYGNNLKIKSVDVTYRVSNAASFINVTTVRIAKDGTATDIIANSTARTDTTWQTYTLTDPTPDVIDGIVFVRFGLTYGAVGHAIYINRVKLVLVGD